MCIFFLHQATFIQSFLKELTHFNTKLLNLKMLTVEREFGMLHGCKTETTLAGVRCSNQKTCIINYNTSFLVYNL